MADVRSGWCLKKSKTTAPWAKAHHSHRFFVSRGHALCYFERAVDGTGDQSGHLLLGLVDLRAVMRVRPSADPSAPEQALDLVMRNRTYVLVPQPATAEERRLWVQAWAPHVRSIAPELRADAGLAPESVATSLQFALNASAQQGLRSQLQEAAGSMSTDHVVLKEGFLLKLPVKSGRGWGSMTSLLGDLNAWRLRWFELRSGGLLQWYQDDPGVGGKFLGVFRLTTSASAELVSNASGRRLRLCASGEILFLKDDVGDTLDAWHELISGQLQQKIPD